MAALIFLLIIVLTFVSTGCTKEEDVCASPDCSEAAKNILDSLDKDVKPCDDFYRFACGNTIKKTVIPEDKVYIDSFDAIKNKIQEQLRAILEVPIGKDDIRPITLVKKYYQACTNEDYIEKNGKKIITDLLKSLGGWPVLEGNSWNEKEFDWTKLTYKFRQLGFDTNNFLGMSVDPDPKNSSLYVVELDQPSLGLQREVLTTRKHSEPYLDLMVNIAVEMGADKRIAKKELNESLEFEIKLANFSLANEDRRNITKLVTHMSIKELQEKYKGSPWLEYINALLPPEVHLKDSDIIIVVVPTYFTSFENLIAQTPKRAQANHALWRAIQEVISLLPKDIYKHFLEAVRIIDGQAQRPLRWKECTDATYSRLPLLVSSLYVRKYFDEDAKKNAQEMVNYIKSTFKEILKTLDWMDDITRQKALDKAAKIAEHIGYPDQLLDNQLLEKYYDKLETNAEQYLKSYLNVSAHQTDFKFKRLLEPVDKLDWTEHGSTAAAGAFYIPLENSIFLPAGILQGIFFNKNRPRYLNFAAIGSIIGHEITHGFDATGRQFDENGNLVNWWEDATEKSFLNKTECMIYQYGNYTVAEVKTNVNGIKTQDENIADNGGIKEAYLAYNAWVKSNGVEPKLPGLTYSPHQLFWISAAMNWCASYKPEYLQNVVAIDTHPPNEFRVLGPFSNSKEFASDFNCPSDARMNPVQKCAVW